jgi:putative endopeptidase
MLVRSSFFVTGAALSLASAPVAAQGPAATADLSTPAPMVFPGWGFDVSGLDRSVDPGDDFDAFVNGKWKAATPIPAKYAAYGVSQNLNILADAAMREIIKEAIDARAAKGTIEQKVADWYLTYLDTPTINRLDLEPARPYLAQINALTSHADLVRLFADPVFASAIGPGITIDRDDPSKYLAVFSMAGYGLPSRDNYLVDNARNNEMRGKYIEFLAFLLKRAGAEYAKARAERIYALEKGIAQNDWDPALARNPELSNNYLSRAQIQALAPDLPLNDLIDGAGFTGVDRFLVPRLKPSVATLDAQRRWMLRRCPPNFAPRWATACRHS